MPYVYTDQTTGTIESFVYKVSQGWKLTPHIKAQRVDKPYRLQKWEFIDGNTNVLAGGQRAGGNLWAEVTPPAGMNGSVSKNSFSFSPDGNMAYARAYTKFKEKIYTQASNLTALQERQASIDMVVSRLKQLYKGAKSLKRGKFKEFLGTFGIKPKPKHANKTWSRPKDFGSLWLEYWMGWAPMVGDVYTTLEFLGKPVPDSPVRAGSTAPVVGSSSYYSSPSRATSSWEGTTTVWIKSKVEVTSPSLYNLQGLGLLNPLKTLWETTPFSWFADWFTNVGQVLGQLTDWVGLELKDLVISCKTNVTLSYEVTRADSVWAGAPPRIYRNREWTHFSRKTGGVLPVVKPIVRLPNGLSITRGATLASLLVTIFAPQRAKPN